MKALAVVVAILGTSLCFANAVMGYALEQYDFTAWWVYVGATVAFEAWAIGKWEGWRIDLALGISIVANTFTALCCTNLCGVGLHGTFVGSQLNPNPLMNMLLMFTVFGFFSSLIEGTIWRQFRGKKPFAHSEGALRLRSILVHLAWVPVGMAIMLVPSRPYPTLEAFTNRFRRMYLEGVLTHIPTDENGCWGSYRDVDDLLRRVPSNSRGTIPRDAWATAYLAHWRRFDVGESRSIHLEWNPAANGHDTTQWDPPAKDKPIWVIRANVDGGCMGWTTEGYGLRHWTTDCGKLGY